MKNEHTDFFGAPLFKPELHDKAKQMKDKFNKYCADVMGYDINGVCDGHIFVSNNTKRLDHRAYNPYDDLNQMAEVVEKLTGQYADGYYENCGDSQINGLQNNFFRITFKQAFRDFIISTMPNTGC